MGASGTLPLLVSLIGTKLSTISHKNAHGLYGPNFELGPINPTVYDVEFFLLFVKLISFHSELQI